MSVDEKDLNKKLRKKTRSYAVLKDGLQKEIRKDLRKKRSTDLLWLCENTGLCPQDATSLYQLLYDRIKKPAGEKNLSTKSLERLTLKEDQIQVVGGSYRLNIDPQYTFRFIMVSDTHIGSKHDNIEGLEAMFDHAKDIGAQAVFHSGDLVDGAFAHRDMYLFLRDECQTFDGQYERVVTKWPKRDGIKTYFIAGNHDHYFWIQPGADICRHIDLARDDMVYLKSRSLAEQRLKKDISKTVLEKVMQSKQLGSGRIGAIRIGPYHLSEDKRNTILMLMHPGDGSGKTMSTKPQKIISNIEILLHSFDNMTNQKGKRIKPHLLQVGHYHKADINLIRNVYVFQSGTMKFSDQFHEVKNLHNMMGYWIVELTTDKTGDIQGLGYRFMEPYVDPTRPTRAVVSMDGFDKATLDKAA